MCSRTFAQKMALIKWMLTSPCDRQDSQRKWRKHGCRSRSARPFWSGILKLGNTVEVHRQWGCGYAIEPPTRLTIARIRDKSETHGTVWDVHKGRSGKNCRTKSPASSAEVLEQFTLSPQKPAKQCARDTGVSRISIRLIFKRARWKVFIPTLLHALNEDDPDWRVH